MLLCSGPSKECWLKSQEMALFFVTFSFFFPQWLRMLFSVNKSSYSLSLATKKACLTFALGEKVEILQVAVTLGRNHLSL